MHLHNKCQSVSLPNRYIFRRVLVGKHANTAKRPLDCASPASDTKPAGKIAKAGTPEPNKALQTDTKVVHKLRQSNDVIIEPSFTFQPL